VLNQVIWLANRWDLDDQTTSLETFAQAILSRHERSEQKHHIALGPWGRSLLDDEIMDRDDLSSRRDNFD
jgi:hypothetical protein